MGGLSSIDFIGTEIDETDLFADPNQDSFVDNKVGLIGLNHIYRPSNTAYIKTTVGGTLMHLDFDQDNYIEESVNGGPTKHRATEVRDSEQRYTVSSQFNKKYSPRFNLRAGALDEFFDLDNTVRDRDRRVEIPDENGDNVPDFFLTTRDVSEVTLLSQAYAQGEFKFTDQLCVTGGLHAQYFELTKDFQLEPRAAISWQYRPKHRFSAAYGLHSQLVPLPVLLLQEEVAPGVMEATNIGLDFIKSHHFVVGYDYKPAPDWKVKTESY